MPRLSVWILAVAILLVLALVVEALDVLKLDVVPQRVVMVARSEFRILLKKLLADRFPVTVSLETVVDPSVDEAEVVIFDALKFVAVPFTVKRLIELALVEEDVVALVVEA